MMNKEVSTYSNRERLTANLRVRTLGMAKIGVKHRTGTEKGKLNVSVDTGFP
jgi:hypothetical protein